MLPSQRMSQPWMAKVEWNNSAHLRGLNTWMQLNKLWCVATRTVPGTPSLLSDSSVSIIGQKSFTHCPLSHPKESNRSSAHVAGTKVAGLKPFQALCPRPTFSSLNTWCSLYPCIKREGGTTIWATTWSGLFLYCHIFLLCLHPKNWTLSHLMFFLHSLCFC